MSVQVLVDGRDRLARVIYRDVVLSAIREEFATVMAREVNRAIPSDEQVFVPASGFSLGATVTKPGRDGRSHAGRDSGRRPRPAGSR